MVLRVKYFTADSMPTTHSSQLA